MGHSFVLRSLMLLLLSAFFLPVTAQEDSVITSTSVNFQIRPRLEIRNGAFTLLQDGDDPAIFVSNRARVSADYRYGNLYIGIAGQNYSVYGNTPQIETDGTFMLNEAWAELFWQPKWSVKVGRQQLAYDGDRILGTLDWHQSGRWHDLVMGRYHGKHWKADLAFAWNQNSERQIDNPFDPTNSQPYKSLQMFRIEDQVGEHFNFSAIYLNLGYQQTDTAGLPDGINNFSTVGANVTWSPASFVVKLAGYYQFGDDASSLSTDAWMGSARVDWRPSSIPFNFWIGVDYLSGNDARVDSGAFVYDLADQNAFNPLYGTHHIYYGLMDYFFVAPDHYGTIGIFDKYIGVGVKAFNRWGFQLAAHHFDGASDITDANGGDFGTYLGTELDLTFTVKVMKFVGISGGYSQMFADDRMEVLKGRGDAGRVQNWGWLMLNVNPQIFKRERKIPKSP
ncbi:alginate export family protein [Pontibacter sp. G13]|uniref:alginate export family protein n=1 Tax=Pontibacter sp. G13 TaxID=3074898 RepID=UPI00288BA84A|nr:alginate export family protein [Pontibacter sp. G13]WNJ17918.1 alginate export family protein [Pontibacter sp. G13]